MKYRLKELFTDKLSGEWGDEGSSQAGVKVIRTTNFTNSGKLKLENLAYRQIDNRKVITKRLKHGDIIIEKSGGSPSQPVGRVVFFDIDTDETFLCNNFTAILRPDRAKVFPMYLFYRLFDNHKTGKTLRYQNKTTGIINLKLDHYLNSKIEIPERVEDQIRIATILSKAESLIAQRKESLRLLDELLKSTFLEMCGDPVRNEKGWKKKKLGEIIQEFKYGTNVISVDKPSENTIAILRIPNIINESITYEGLKYSILEEREKERVRLKKGDLLFVRSNGNPNYIGRCAVFNDDIVCGYASYLIRARLREGVLITPFFLKAILSFPRYRNVIVSKAKTTAGNYNINIESLKSLIIIAPPPKLQTQFTRIVEKVEALKAHYQDSLKKLENLYGSLSQRAFKGEL